MDRITMLRSILLLASLLGLSCRETATPPTHGEPAVAPESADPTTPPEPSATSPTVIRIVGDTVSLDGAKVARTRPADAPGMLGEDMRATYALPELQAALKALDPPAAPLMLVVGPQTPLSHLRAVLASGADPVTLVVDPAPDTVDPQPDRGWSLRAAAADALPPVVVRPRGDAVRLWVDDAPGSEPLAAGELAAGLGALDPARLADGVAIGLPDEATAGTLVPVLQALPRAAGGPTALALEFDPCLTPPPDMRCIPGGPAIVGADDGPPEERPQRELLISTFYIDRHEVTIEQYDACRADAGCKVRINGYQGIMKPFVGPTQPAMPMDFRRAQSYCAWAGKRLPTEWEWEKAARGPDGEIYPWGNDEPSCDKTIYRNCAPWGCTPYPGTKYRYDCPEHATKPVGSFPAGHYGLHEMAGNGYEWTRSAGVPLISECGTACQGRDPQGRCDGASPCEGLRVLKGGSWYWPKARLRGSHRRIEKIKTGSHRLGMRCATEHPYLTDFPPRVLTADRPALEIPEPPTEQELAAFAKVTHDPVQDKKICDAKVREGWHPSQSDGGRSELNCRDPFSYLTTNEPRGYVWKDYIDNLGGAYVGIGSDQNFNYIAAARSRWAWVMDYDPRVVKNHRRLRALILAAPTRDDFVALFAPDNERRAADIISAAYPDDPALKQLRWGYVATRERMHAYFTKQRKAAGQGKSASFGWLRTEDDYRYIRTLYQQGRLRAVAGDLLREGAMQSIAQAARDLGVPVRIYYTSNAPTAWGAQITEAYRANVLSLPFDEQSLVLRTTDGGGSLRQKTKWHHNVQWGRHMHQRLRRAGYDTVWKVIEGRIPGDDDALTILGLPSGEAEG
ncbi:MAG: SUMF1/EgtB/PvdO family nonheme iron enzyme [Myxococcota bacterium]